MSEEIQKEQSGFFPGSGERMRVGIIFLVACVYPVALVYSKFALTICMLFWFLAAILVFSTGSGRLSIRMNPEIFRRGQSFFRSPYSWITLFFWMVLLSGLGSVDIGYWMERLRIKLPFLVLPFAFFLFPDFSSKQIRLILYSYLGILLLSSLDVGFGYLRNYEEITLGLGKGHPIPTPVSHIRYSLMLAFGVLVAFYLYRQPPVFRSFPERPLLLGVSIFFFIFLHILSVRSGLLVLYLATGLGGILFFSSTGRWVRTVVFLLVLAVIPIVAYHSVPSFRNRMNYARHDLQMYLQGKGAGYSDSGRLLSLTIGWDIFLENPWFGTGIGDLKKEVEAHYRSDFPDLRNIAMPHNQFLSVLAGSGIVGFLVFSAAFFVPFFWMHRRNHYLFSLFYLIIFISFFVENTLETAVGVGFFSFFLLLFSKERPGGAARDADEQGG